MCGYYVMKTPHKKLAQGSGVRIWGLKPQIRTPDMCEGCSEIESGGNLCASEFKYMCRRQQDLVHAEVTQNLLKHLTFNKLADYIASPVERHCRSTPDIVSAQQRHGWLCALNIRRGWRGGV